ncbi:hypothetical protein SPONL_1507 [uncultured Candidatus Thioglobus sp.]|nr:hypothetical protein SPONL_1507 [uncultured Candidatus Thioglobus sp.]
MSSLPSAVTNPYSRSKLGYSGELGNGSGVVIKFLQTGITYDELDNLNLIESIPGSEKWNVRDLFQRTVDKERVTRSILPYLQDSSKVKFFNPLTLVLVPFDTDKIETSLSYVEAKLEDKEGHKYDMFKMGDAFRFCIHKEQPAYSYVEWNELKARVVAIDGQHRLSALKEWKSDPETGRDFSDWTIPVVILGLFKEKDGGSPPSLLEVIRKTFVYINTTAKEINESRKTLLDDEKVNCICTQEVIQRAHENDQKEIGKLVREKLPLMFFDWRGEVKNGRADPGPASIISAEEIKLWFENFLLGEDSSEQQSEALNLKDCIPPLGSFGKGLVLSNKDALRIREQFKRDLLPAFSYLMENFEPYKKYTLECRKKQLADELECSTVTKNAYQKICFGSYRVGAELVSLVETRYGKLVKEFSSLKKEIFHPLIVRDVGMRGVWSAFSSLKVIKDTLEGNTNDWLDYAKWFVKLMNTIYNEGWFKDFEELDSDQQGFLMHVVYDLAGGVVNYRHSDVKDALGTFLALLIAKHSTNKDLQHAAWDELSVNFRKPLKKGLKKQLRGELRDSIGSQKELRDELNNKTEEKVEERLEKLKKYLD